MWDVYYMNFAYRGIGFLDTDRELMKKFTSEEDMKELEPLTNYELIRLADGFLPLKFGNILHGSSESVLRSFKLDAQSAYPLIYESFYGLLCEFLDYKLEFGTVKEKEIYTGMSACDLVDRLLTKRCATAFGRNENYLLSTGEKGQGEFSKVGTDDEVHPLLIENCLTHDEIKLSGFVLISSKVTKSVKDKTFNVITIGIPFPILNIGKAFDSEDLFVTKFQNTQENGYGKFTEGTQATDIELYKKTKWRAIWDRFYNNPSTEYISMDKNYGKTKKDEVVSPYRMRETYGRFWKMHTHRYIDLYRLAKRFSLITLGLLQEANARAKAENKMAYIVFDKHKIGLGTQPAIFEEIFLRNFAYELLCLFRELNNTAQVHFVDFTELSTMKNGCRMSLMDGVYGIQHPNEAIDIKYSTREELNAEMVSILEDEKYLVVESYRLDQNALPGNSLWMGKVDKEKGHPSFEVRNTAIPFIHNPLINRTRLCGNNLRFYSLYGVCNWTNIKYHWNQ